jgi:hypothetical protein
MNSMLIEAREWFDKYNGQTYHSTRIWIDGEVACQTGLAYGGHNQYETTAVEQLVMLGLLPAEAKSRALWLIAKTHNITIYSTRSESLKRDLFKPYLADRYNKLLSVAPDSINKPSTKGGNN